ncbi:MAG: hypothetical protein IT462_10005 [Planctomycetes bacterium]|nr:hypothetical protein [Planctomycetota bacterium]
MTPTLIGYIPKRTEKQPYLLEAPGVTEIASVADCISEAPDNWIQHWRHNSWWVFSTMALALSIIPDAEQDQFDLYAYRVFPIRFDAGRSAPFDVRGDEVEPRDDSFDCLGIDVVSREFDAEFSHSPLSCNYLARERPTNRYCLLDTLESALDFATSLAASKAEPGPYFVVEVWRQRGKKH